MCALRAALSSMKDMYLDRIEALDLACITF